MPLFFTLVRLRGSLPKRYEIAALFCPFPPIFPSLRVVCWAEITVLLQIKVNCSVSLWKHICFYRIFHLDPCVVQGTAWLWEEGRLLCSLCMLTEGQIRLQEIQSSKCLLALDSSSPWAGQSRNSKPNLILQQTYCLPRPRCSEQGNDHCSPPRVPQQRSSHLNQAQLFCIYGRYISIVLLSSQQNLWCLRGALCNGRGKKHSVGSSLGIFGKGGGAVQKQSLHNSTEACIQ